MTKVSIIIPVYNASKYIKNCLNSILAQTMSDYEIILIDDNSTDHSYDIMYTYAKNYPKIIKLIHNDQNSGPGKSRNIGVSLADGEYISFIDSDDYIAKDMIEKMYLGCKENGSQIARVNLKKMYKGIDLSYIGRNINFTEDQVIIPKKQPEYISKETPACINKLFNHEFIKDKKFPEDLKWEDLPYTIPLLVKADTITSITSTNYFYNINPSGTTCSDTRRLSPKILDIFTDVDMIEKECINKQTPQDLKEQLIFVQMVNCIQRLRDILYSNIPVKDKKELITLMSQLIDKKYGSWRDNELYQKQKQNNKLYGLRMNTIEKYFLKDYDNNLSEEEIKVKIKEKVKNKL